jgi:hypothetical protein
MKPNHGWQKEVEVGGKGIKARIRCCATEGSLFLITVFEYGLSFIIPTALQGGLGVLTKQGGLPTFLVPRSLNSKQNSL